MRQRVRTAGAVALAAAALGLAAGPAAGASEIYLDADGDAAGGLDISSVFVESDGATLSFLVLLSEAPVLPGDAVTISLDADADARTGDPVDGKEWWLTYQLSSFSGNPIPGMRPYRPEAGGLDHTVPSPPSFVASAGSRIVSFRVALAEVGLRPDSVISFSARSSARTSTGVTDRFPEYSAPVVFFSLAHGPLGTRVRDRRCVTIPARVKTRTKTITRAQRAVRRAKTKIGRKRAVANLKRLRATQIRDRRAITRLCDLTYAPPAMQEPVLPGQPRNPV